MRSQGGHNSEEANADWLDEKRYDDSRGKGAVTRGVNPTTIVSVVAASMWMIDNPNEGVLVPDQLPWRYVMDIAKDYLGEMRSVPVDWDPLKTRNDLYKGLNGRSYDSDPWQFNNFLV